jgi:hypothetical protein
VTFPEPRAPRPKDCKVCPSLCKYTVDSVDAVGSKDINAQATNEDTAMSAVNARILFRLNLRPRALRLAGKSFTTAAKGHDSMEMLQTAK